MNAKRRTNVARGNEAAQRIRAQGGPDRDRTGVGGGASKAEIIRGEADARRNEIFAKPLARILSSLNSTAP